MTMMKFATALWLSSLLVLPGAPSHAAAPALTNDVNLSAEGGVSFKTPAWRVEKSEAAPAVLARAPDNAKKLGFGLLVLAIEEGPESTEGLDWSRVRDNIVAAAKATGSGLALEVGDPFQSAKGFSGRLMTGTTKVGERTVKVEMVALAAPKVLVTVSSVGRSDDSGVAGLAASVAATARRPDKR